jgi:hypothetical protein
MHERKQRNRQALYRSWPGTRDEWKFAVMVVFTGIFVVIIAALSGGE